VRWLAAIGLLLLTPATAVAGDTLVGAGDIAECTPPSEETAQLVEAVIAAEPDTVVFTVGDNAYGDGASDDTLAGAFAECYHPTWGRFRERTRPTIGNHDYRVERGAPYYAYFGVPAWYAYDLGGWRVYALNSEEVSLQQVWWLQDDLARHPRQCSLAYWHRPLVSSGRNGREPAVEPLWEALADAGAELVVNGHDHNYERFALLDGMREVVVGTGGAELRAFENVEPTSQVRIAGIPGVLRLELEADRYTGSFITAAGVQDTFSGDCREQPSAPGPTPQAAVVLLGVFSATLALLWTMSRQGGR
jgi:hypothetical protein